MGAKKQQGADSLEFKFQITKAGFDSINLPEECLRNKAGNVIAKIKCWGGRLFTSINLPHAIRPNNVDPFKLSDCIQIEIVRNQVIEFFRLYLQKHFHDKSIEDLLTQLTVTKMECNLTIKCVGNCKPKAVLNLFEKAFPKAIVYKETDNEKDSHKKPERGVTTSKSKEWILKVYDKSYELKKAGDLKVEPNLVRVELVFIDRALKRMYSNKRALVDILTRRSIETLIDQYQVIFDAICGTQLKNVMKSCTQEVFESLTYSETGQEIKDTVARCKEYILDFEILRRALRRWYKFRGMTDNSKQAIAYYRKGNFGIPADVLKTIKLMHDSIGER